MCRCVIDDRGGGSAGRGQAELEKGVWRLDSWILALKAAVSGGRHEALHREKMGDGRLADGLRGVDVHAEVCILLRGFRGHVDLRLGIGTAMEPWKRADVYVSRAAGFNQLSV